MGSGAGDRAGDRAGNTAGVRAGDTAGNRAGNRAGNERRAEAERRVGRALREVRRGTAMQRVRELVLGDHSDALELGAADTLALLVEAGGLRMSELADALRVDASTATRAVARLEHAGLVVRESAPEDGRVVRVVPTAAGTASHRAIRGRQADVMARVCSGFSDAELELLGVLLDRLVGGIDSVASAPRDGGGQPKEHS